MDQLQLYPLSTLINGQQGIVVKLSGDRKFRERLLMMGIYIGSHFEVIHNGQGNGPSLIMVEASRIALDHGMAQYILVLPSPKQDSAWDSAMTRLKRIWSLS